MCRITVDTNMALSLPMRKLFFDRTMLTSNADNQHDGVGMTDGHMVYKTHYPYMCIGQNWLSQLQPNAMWLGHVRSASRGTAISPRTAHPFRFILNDGRALTAMHNGFINGMKAPEIHEPRVDSYQAFKILKDLLDRQAGTIFTAALVNEWTATFGIDSEWAFAFSLDNVITILRGNRPISFMSFDKGGEIFNTSSEVLTSVKEWILQYWATDYKIGRVTDVKEFQMVTVANGKITYEGIMPQERTPVYDHLYIKSDSDVEALIKL